MTRNVSGLTVNLYAPSGLRSGANEVVIEFLDPASGSAADVGTVSFDLTMSMPGMPMQAGGEVSPAGQPGRYRVRVKPDMSGDWNARLRYDGPRGQGAVSFNVKVN